MNLKRSLSSQQKYILSSVASGKHIYTIRHSSFYWNFGTGSLMLRENPMPVSTKYVLKALRALVQRGLLVSDESGLLMLAGDAIKCYGHLAPSIKTVKRVIKMYRTRPMQEGRE